MKSLLLVVSFILALVTPALAQHADIVAAVKAELQAQGKDLSGPCGAFAITKRVAWRLRGEGAGLLSKPAGNNCEGYSVDYVTYPDGSGVDILSDAGGANGPGWDQGEVAGALSGRWRAPFDPGDAVVPPPLVTPPPVVIVVPPTTLPPPVTAPPGDLLAQIAALRLELASTKGVVDETLVQLKEHRAGVQAVWLKVAAIGGPVMAAILTYVQLHNAPAAATK